MELLKDLERHGLNVVLIGKNSLGVFPKELLTDELRELIKNHKNEIIRMLKQHRKHPSEDYQLSAMFDPKVTDRLNEWGCFNCSWLLSDDEAVCVVEDKNTIHMVSIPRLKDCPKRNKQICQAILRGDHLSWLN